MKSSKLNATSLKLLLISAFIIIAVSMVGSFYYAHGWLKRFAAESNINIPDSSSLPSKTLDQSQTATSLKLNSLILDSLNYFENIKVDINKYASDNNLVVSTSEAPQDTVNGLNNQVVTGLQSKFVVVSFNGPVNFNDFLKFINGIETNTPKIKIMGINITKLKDSNGQVNISPIILKVYTR